jgi:hypothetical protein
MRVQYKTTQTGATFEQINEAVVKAFVDAVLQDHRATPDQFAKSGRKGRTPFKRTGELVDPLTGFFFKPAGKRSAKTGYIGMIRAPADRFASREVRDRFLAGYLWKLWATRGIGFSKAGI